jgi:chromosome segregation ATPase
MKELRKLAAEAASGANTIQEKIRFCDERLEEIRQLKNHIFNYSRTKKIYAEYKRTGCDPQFLAKHEGEIRKHEAAKAMFDQLPDKKIPKVKDLNAEYSQIVEEKKKAYAAYRMARNKLKELQIALKNAEIILEDEQSRKRQERTREARATDLL